MELSHKYCFYPIIMDALIGSAVQVPAFLHLLWIHISFNVKHENDTVYDIPTSILLVAELFLIYGNHKCCVFI